MHTYVGTLKLYNLGKLFIIFWNDYFSGLMIVFGGNTHNDTSVSHGAKCYSADVLAYDMVCDKWYVLLFFSKA